MLYLRFTLSMAIQDQVRSLGRAREELDQFALLPEEYTGGLRRHALAESVHYSTAIEGNTLTLQQVKTLIEGGTVRAPRHQVQEAENYREAVAYVQSLVMVSGAAASEDVVRAIHYLISKSLPGAYAAGQYRTEQNYVVDRVTGRRIFTPPAHQDVPPLMREMVDWLNSDYDYPMSIKAGLAHLNFVAIHPFLDGNGRVARVLDSLVMYRGGFRSQDLVSVEAYFGEDNRGYYRALAAALGPRYSPERDVTSWVEYHLGAHVAQARAAVEATRQTVGDMDKLWDALEGDGLPAWQLIAVYLAGDDGQVSNRQYREMTGRSAQSAVADFTALIEKGLLTRSGRGRGVVYVPTQRTWDIFTAIRQDDNGA